MVDGPAFGIITKPRTCTPGGVGQRGYWVLSWSRYRSGSVLKSQLRRSLMGALEVVGQVSPEPAQVEEESCHPYLGSPGDPL